MEHESEHDVIVVGAGPSGAATATALSRMGYDVLLLDRSEFPRDKVCGDAVSLNVIEMLNHLGMESKILEAERRGEFYPLHSMRLISPKGYEVSVPFHEGENGESSYVAPRYYFDAVIKRQAVDSGAQFCVADVKRPLLEEGSVTGVEAQVNGDTRTFRSRLVVGADGVTSAIMRHLRPEKYQHNDGHRAVALRAYIDDLELHPHEVEFFLYDKILPGYAWVFPISDTSANIGLGMRLDHFRRLKRNLKKMLQDFLSVPSIKARLKNGGELRDVATWQLNFGSQKDLQHAYDGALLVGDAAGFINPLTGGGIHSGLVSALLAADTIDEALRRNDTSRAMLSRYEERCEEEMWDGMRKAYLYQRLLEKMPWAIDFLLGGPGQRSGIAQIFLSKL